MGKCTVLLSGIFMKPQKLENKCLYNSDANLWDSCEVVNLKTNFRVGNKVWKETLERIRYGEQTLEDYELLRSRYTRRKPGFSQLVYFDSLK